MGVNHIGEYTICQEEDWANPKTDRSEQGSSLNLSNSDQAVRASLGSK